MVYSYFLYGIPFIGSRFYCRLLKTFAKSTAINYLFKVNDKSTRTRFELCSKLTTQTLGRRHCSRSDVFIFNFEHVSCFALMFPLLILNKYLRIFRDTI